MVELVFKFRYSVMLVVYQAWIVLLPFSRVLAQVFVVPSKQRLAYSGATTDFECVSASQLIIQSIEWQINGSLFDDSTFDNIQQALLRLEGSNEIRGGALTITNTPVEYNTTTVQCIVEYTTGSSEITDTATLLVQGTLDAVKLMVFVSENSEVYLNWTAPFTLLGASDITYCVDIVGTTKRRALLSKCMVNMAQFTFIMPHILVCEGLSFSVTPVNVVGNGTAGTLMLTNNTRIAPELVEVVLLPTEVTLVMSDIVCDAELRLVDDAGEIITLGNTDVTITETNITFSTQQLREYRDYNVTITASNIAGSVTSRTTLSRAVYTTDSDIATRSSTTIALETRTIDVQDSSCQGNSYTVILITVATPIIVSIHCVH